MRLGRSFARTTAALGVGVALAACTAAEPAAAPDTDPATGHRAMPLDEYLPAIWGLGISQEERLLDFEERLRREGQLTAECMAEQGFEFVAMDPREITRGLVGGERWPDDREWVAEWGFGLVREPRPDLPPEALEPARNPNHDRVAGYSAAQREAWFGALLGDAPSYADWEREGCTGWARHQAEQELNPLARPEFTRLAEAIEDFRARWYTEAATVHLADLHHDWAACMTLAGHPGLRTQGDAREEIWTRLTSIEDAGFQGDRDTHPPLVELFEDEVALALADLDCRVDVNFAARADDAREAAEREFIAAHRDELDALRAAAEQGG